MTRWQRHLIAASGYLELGMLEEADREMSEIPDGEKSIAEVIGFRVHLAMRAGKWETGAELARHLVGIDPGQAEWWINHAFCIRRAESVAHAEEILLRAIELHPNEALIHYNLGCYACVTGRLDLAKQRLASAISRDPDIRKLVSEDDDLKPLWEWMAGEGDSIR